MNIETTNTISLRKSYEGHKQIVDNKLQFLSKKLAFLTEKIGAFEKQMTEIAENRDRIKEEIRVTGEQIIAQVLSVNGSAGGES